MKMVNWAMAAAYRQLVSMCNGRMQPAMRGFNGAAQIGAFRQFGSNRSRH